MVFFFFFFQASLKVIDVDNGNFFDDKLISRRFYNYLFYPCISKI